MKFFACPLLLVCLLFGFRSAVAQGTGPQPTTWGRLKSFYGQQYVIESPREPAFESVRTAINSNPLLHDVNIVYVGKVGSDDGEALGFYALGYPPATMTGPYLVVVKGNFCTTRCFCFEGDSSEVRITDILDGGKTLWVGAPSDLETGLNLDSETELTSLRGQLEPASADATHTFACRAIAGAIAIKINQMCAGVPACPWIAFAVYLSALTLCEHPEAFRMMPGEEYPKQGPPVRSGLERNRDDKPLEEPE